MYTQHVNDSRKTESILKAIRRRNVCTFSHLFIMCRCGGGDNVPTINCLYIFLLFSSSSVMFTWIPLNWSTRGPVLRSISESKRSVCKWWENSFSIILRKASVFPPRSQRVRETAICDAVPRIFGYENWLQCLNESICFHWYFMRWVGVIKQKVPIPNLAEALIVADDASTAWIYFRYVNGVPILIIRGRLWYSIALMRNLTPSDFRKSYESFQNGKSLSFPLALLRPIHFPLNLLNNLKHSRVSTCSRFVTVAFERWMPNQVDADEKVNANSNFNHLRL